MPEGEQAPESFTPLHDSDKPDELDKSGNTGQTDPGLLNPGAGVSVLPHKKYLLNRDPFVRSYCPYCTDISVTLVTSIYFFQQIAGNEFFFPPKYSIGSKCDHSPSICDRNVGLRLRYAR